MLTKSEITKIKQLSKKKYRIKAGLFVAEGEKVIYELLNEKYVLKKLYTTKETTKISAILISDHKMQQISHFKNPSKFLGVFKLPLHSIPKNNFPILALDRISDPGNLGTIIRTCDWFGIDNIVCSLNSVDCFNPKVIQSSMGSISRVKCHYIDLINYLNNSKFKIIATTIKAEKSIYDFNLTNKVIYVFGNESNGISSDIIKLVNEKIFIPKTAKNSVTDSLNVASAVSILLGERFRQLK